jgi:RNA polymerase sigma-70 factor, ECF subfamily
MKKHIRWKPGMAIEQSRGTVVDDFSLVTEKYRPQIFRFLLASLRDVDLAETLTQDCFLKAHLNWSNFRGEATARTWLMRIAINLQKDHWRNRRMRFWRHTRTNSIDLDDASEWLPSYDSSPEQRVIAREQVREVWKVMEQLSERQRIIFVLRFVEELKLCEIARATGLQEGTVKAHISRAVTKVRNALKQRQTNEPTSQSHF